MATKRRRSDDSQLSENTRLQSADSGEQLGTGRGELHIGPGFVRPQPVERNRARQGDAVLPALDKTSEWSCRRRHAEYSRACRGETRPIRIRSERRSPHDWGAPLLPTAADRGRPTGPAVCGSARRRARILFAGISTEHRSYGSNFARPLCQQLCRRYRLYRESG